ncbi:MAG: chromosome segregation protein SMC, partial [Candidatus Omnitrophica bacterium]|nr:chromosome segregation protein SMC [Candidatus Omnitrophota bacterium]
MHFKRLEICGFKSFAEKTELEFHPGVTAIVGPNGCGKSNVSDSIKWVLGEQSARSLRGHRMEDIIFNGALAREAVNFAEVSIIFSNEDRAVPMEYDEIMITRRLYRSGESEYLINKSQVRLKDIQSMLAGTGLGVGNYSVIEQGRINQILTAKPEDRRTLFEEAAGITRFKQQKREALRNLEATEQNLQRVTDIIVEQKRQIGSLERQAKKAEAYKRDFNKLKTHDLIVAREERERFITEIDSRRELNSELKAGLEELAGLCESAEEELAEARQALQAIDQEYQETKSQHLILENQIRNNNEKTSIFATYIEEIRQKLEGLETAAREAAERIVSMEAEEAGLAQTIEAIEIEREAGQQLVEESEAAFAGLEQELAFAKEEWTAVKAALAANIEEEHRVESALGLAASERAAKETDRIETSGEIESLSVQAQILHDECRTAEEQAAMLSHEIRERILDRERLEGQLVQDREEAKGLEQQVLALGQEAASKQSKLEMMEHFAKSHEGFSQGARHILELTQTDAAWENRILGALADLVEVERGYEVAVESALGSLSQAIVCERDEDTAELGRRLREARQGRAVLLRLDAPTLGTSAEVLPEEGMRRLIDVTRANERVSKMYTHLVRNIFVASDAAQAADLSRRYPQGVFVTREGEAYRAMTVLIGSADSSEESLIFGRESRIKEIKAHLLELSMETERLTARKEQVAAKIIAIEEALKTQSEVVPRLQVKLADVQSRKELRGNEREKVDERLGRHRATLVELETRLAALGEEESGLKVEFEAVTLRLLESEQRSLSLQELIEGAARRREDMLIEITRRKSQFETVLQRAEQSQRSLDRTREGLRVERAAIETRQRDQEALSARQTETQSQLETLRAHSETLSYDRDALLERHNAIAIEKEDRATRLTDTESRHTELFARQQSDRERTHTLEMEIERTMHEAQRLKDRIYAAYQIDLDNETPVTMLVELPEVTEAVDNARVLGS